MEGEGRGERERNRGGETGKERVGVRETQRGCVLSYLWTVLQQNEHPLHHIASIVVDLLL